MIDFKIQQAAARRRTKLLFVLYICLVVVWSILLTPVVWSLGGFIESVSSSKLRSVDSSHSLVGQYTRQVTVLHDVSIPMPSTPIAIGICALSSVIMGIASLVRWSELRSGGHVIAESVGARLVPPTTNDPDERRLVNVVEEMAIASAIPAPSVYVLDEERGVNAFAAGVSRNDVSIVVTSGMLKRLSREQLQGVIAHEFSHVFNGDMRLSLIAISLSYGFVAIAALGRVICSSRSSEDDSRRRNGIIHIFVIGLILIVLGMLGTFIAKILCAALSRQREYLADAYAVEFTRNPQGIAGALKVIGSTPSRGRIISERMAEFHHMCIVDGLGTRLLTTHPPLESRIKRLEPSWNGEYPQFDEIPPGVMAAKKGVREYSARVRGLEVTQSGVSAMATLSVGDATQFQGWSADETLRKIADARAILDSIDSKLLDSLHNVFDARAAVLAMLLSRNQGVREAQCRGIESVLGPTITSSISMLRSTVASLSEEQRLPALLIAVGTLGQMSHAQYMEFTAALTEVRNLNPHMDLFKLCVWHSTVSRLRAKFAKRRSPAQYYGLMKLAEECSVVYSALLVAGEVRDSTQLLERMAQQVRVRGLRVLPAEEITAQRISSAFEKLSLASEPLRRAFVDSCAVLAGSDQMIKHLERELITALADALDVPLVGSRRS